VDLGWCGGKGEGRWGSCFGLRLGLVGNELESKKVFGMIIEHSY